MKRSLTLAAAALAAITLVAAGCGGSDEVRRRRRRRRRLDHHGARSVSCSRARKSYRAAGFEGRPSTSHQTQAVAFRPARSTRATRRARCRGRHEITKADGQSSTSGARRSKGAEGPHRSTCARLRRRSSPRRSRKLRTTQGTDADVQKYTARMSNYTVLSRARFSHPRQDEGRPTITPGRGRGQFRRLAEPNSSTRVEGPRRQAHRQLARPWRRSTGGVLPKTSGFPSQSRPVRLPPDQALAAVKRVGDPFAQTRTQSRRSSSRAKNTA
jgi:hypothetical protein